MAKKRTRQQKIRATSRPVPEQVPSAKSVAQRSAALNPSVMGYDFSLIKRDLLKTIAISGVLIAGLIALSFYLR